MNDNFEKSALKTGAFATLSGSLCMIVGAVIFGVSGADFDVFHEANDITGYLTAAKASKSLLLANLTVWTCRYDPDWRRSVHDDLSQQGKSSAITGSTL